MRKFIAIILITISIILAYSIYKNQQENLQVIDRQVENTPTPTQIIQSGNNEVQPTESDSTGSGTQTRYLVVRDKSKLKLFSNLRLELNSEELKNKYSCTYLISAGFYSKENKHLGLFISDGNQISGAIESDLFNGYFYIDNNENPYITTSPPKSARLAVQSGPLIMINSQPLKLTLNSDENARRIVVATTTDNNLIFLVLYQGNSVLLGPKLSELGAILNEINKNSSLSIKNALNLDGGSASAFLTDNDNIKEFSKIGGFFCVGEGLIIN